MKDCPKEVVTAGAYSLIARRFLKKAMRAIADQERASELARDALKTEGVSNVALAEGFMLLGDAKNALNVQMAAHGKWAAELERRGYTLPSDDDLSKEAARIRAEAGEKAVPEAEWR